MDLFWYFWWNEASGDGDGDGRMWRQAWVHILSRISHFSVPTNMLRSVLPCATAGSGAIHHALYCHIIGFISPELLLGSHTFCPGIINSRLNVNWFSFSEQYVSIVTSDSQPPSFLPFPALQRKKVIAKVEIIFLTNWEVVHDLDF